MKTVRESMWWKVETARKSQANSTQTGQGESCWQHTKMARESSGWKVETARESQAGSTQNG